MSRSRHAEAGSGRGPVTSRPSRILRVEEVSARLGISRATVWRWERAGHLPRKRQIGPNVVGFLESEIEEFIAQAFGAEKADATDPTRRG